ncbi:EH domain-containing protein 4 [Balamuthia mandrillaris]
MQNEASSSRGSENFSSQLTADPANLFPEVVEGLKQLYTDMVKPVEQRYKFDEFHSPSLRDSDFEARPMVLLLGQYSVGKTSFIEYMLKGRFPGQRIGPEPTTDRFVAVMFGEEERVIPGNALSVDASKPFTALNKFGASFLGKFEAAELPNPLLEHLTFVDTPGVLSGEKQRIGRSYDFAAVTEWFAERADLILLMFDAHKLDISDEFKRTIEMLKGQDDKIRVVLNKADMVDAQQLMRVYGALMWSLGKVVLTPEVMRVYIGSFWDEPLRFTENEKLFAAEQTDLLKDLKELPRNSAMRKVNEFVKRARLVKVHAYIISHLKKKMPAFFGKDSKKKELIENLLNECKEIKRMYKLPAGDFPNIERMKVLLQDHNFDEFAKVDLKLIGKIDEVLSIHIPKLIQKISPQKHEEDLNPFSQDDDDPVDADDDKDANGWEVRPSKKREYDAVFHSHEVVNGKVSGNVIKETLMKTGVPNAVLRKIWSLADIDKDGKLDAEEFAVAMHLCEEALASPELEVPTSLQERLTLVPPAKRQHFHSSSSQPTK